MKPLNLIPLIVILAVGFGISYELYRPKPGKPETPAVEVRQKDGSLELQRAPGDPKSTKPAQEMPKGATLERTVEVTVQPKPSGGMATALPPSPGSPGFDPTKVKIQALGGLGASETTVCAPVRVDLSLIRLKDKSQRVLASSPDGTVISGIDVPVDAVKIPKTLRWTAEGLRGYDMHQGRGVWGGQLSYQRGPIVGSAGVVGATIFVGAGVRF